MNERRRRLLFFWFFLSPIIILSTVLPITLNNRESNNSTTPTTTTSPPTISPVICNNFDLRYEMSSGVSGKIFSYSNDEFFYLQLQIFIEGNILTFIAHNSNVEIYLDNDIQITSFQIISDNNFHYVFYYKFTDQYNLYVTKLDSNSIIWTSVFSNNKISGDMVLPKIYNNYIYYSNNFVDTMFDSILKIDMSGNGVFIPLSDASSTFFPRNIEIVNDNIFIYRFFMQVDFVKYDSTGNLISSNLDIPFSFASSGSSNDGNMIYISLDCSLLKFDQNTNIVSNQILEQNCLTVVDRQNALYYFDQKIYMVAVNNTLPLLIVYSTVTNSTLNIVPYEQDKMLLGHFFIDYDYINKIVYFGSFKDPELPVEEYIISAFCFY